MMTTKIEYVELEIEVMNVTIEKGYATTGSVGDGDIIIL